MASLLASRPCLSGGLAGRRQAARISASRAFAGTPLQQRRRPQQNSRCRRVTTMGLFGLGLPEVAVVAGIAVLVFGPSKLPELGKELGKTVKSFQTAAKEFETELKNAADDAGDKIEGKAEEVKDQAGQLKDQAKK